MGATGLRAELYSNIGSVLAAIPPILQVLVFGGLYEALVVLAGYLIVNGIRQYSRTSYHGARAGPLDAGGIPA